MIKRFPTGLKIPNVPPILKEYLDFSKDNATRVSSPYNSQKNYFEYAEEIIEASSKGSITASRIIETWNLWLSGTKLIDSNMKQAISFISQAFRLEQHIVLLRKDMETIIQEYLKNNPNDKDAMTCYYFFKQDYGIGIEYLNRCIEAHPDDSFFYDMRSCMSGFTKEYKEGLEFAEKGLAIDPKNSSLLYNKATFFYYLGMYDESIKSFNEFLIIAPKDHRNVPKVYYRLGSIQMIKKKSNSLDVSSIEYFYNKGLEHEKIQLPCYLPYSSPDKKLLEIPIRDIGYAF